MDSKSLKRILSIVSLIIFASAAFAQEVFGTDQKAYALAPSIIISSGPTKTGSFSRSGKIILYKRLPVKKIEDYLFEKPDDEYEWYAYSRTTQISSRLMIPNHVSDPVVMSGDQVVTYVDDETKKRCFYHLSTQKIVSVAEPDVRPMNNGFLFSFLVYPTKNGIRLIFTDGQLVNLGLNPGLEMVGPVGEDRASIYFLALVGKSGDSIPDRKPHQYVRLAVDRLTGAMVTKSLSDSELQQIFDGVGLNTEDEFDVESDGNGLYVSVAEDEPSVNKTTIPKRALVGPGANYSRSYDEFSIVYQVGGALLLRDIQPLSLDLALNVSQTNLQKALLKDAQQMGIACLILAADYDDELPNARDWKDKILPYIKDADLVNRFNYTFKGGTVNVDDPTTTELGFVVGLGGRAVVYLDGSSKWVPNP